MPKNSRVDRCFQDLKKTMEIGKAAAICQKSTGQSLKTGRKPKRKR